jgi:hypothetical protein
LCQQPGLGHGSEHYSCSVRAAAAAAAVRTCILHQDLCVGMWPCCLLSVLTESRWVDLICQGVGPKSVTTDLRLMIVTPWEGMVVVCGAACSCRSATRRATPFTGEGVNLIVPEFNPPGFTCEWGWADVKGHACVGPCACVSRQGQLQGLFAAASAAVSRKGRLQGLLPSTASDGQRKEVPQGATTNDDHTAADSLLCRGLCVFTGLPSLCCCNKQCALLHGIRCVLCGCLGR